MHYYLLFYFTNMLALATKLKSAARADHTMFGFFNDIDIAFAAFDFPRGVLTQLFSRHGIIKCIGHCLECAAPGADSNGRFESLYAVRSSWDECIHAILAVVQKINAAQNSFFVLGSFLEELHMTDPFCCFNIIIIASKGYSVK